MAYEDPPDARSAALYYTSLRLHVFPINPSNRVPLVKWRELQTRPATPDEIYRWWSQWDAAGVCILGADNLGIFDLDNPHFSQWVEAGIAPLLGTWVVKTGSDKIHVYMRGAHESIPSTVLKNGDTKLADIRGGIDGRGTAYVVAPPSAYYQGGRYRTLYGSPDAIRVFPDPLAVWEQAIALYNRQFYTGSPEIVLNGRDTERSMDIMAPVDAERKAYLAERLHTTLVLRSTRGLILGTQKINTTSGTSNSEPDFAVVGDLMRNGFTATEIEEIFASFVLGEYTYRNSNRSHHGHSYLMHTIGTHTTRIAKSEQSAGEAVGSNFRVNHVTRLELDPPLYELSVVEIDEISSEPINDAGIVVMSVDDIYSQTRLQKRITDAIGIVPLMKPAFNGGAGYQKFAALLLAMADHEQVPVSATTSGHLRVYLLDLLHQANQVALGKPTHEKAFQLGWREPEGKGDWVYVRSGHLIRTITGALKPPPPPEKVWMELRKLGGKETHVRYEETGVGETLWALPKAMIDE